ncbi:MAG: hypothetical protein ACTSR8_17975 [Promethearchaeota archaeon]
MMKKKEESTEENEVEIAKFLLKDTRSLRNEMNFLELEELLHPLTFTYSKKHSNIQLIPITDKAESKRIKELFFKIFE